MDAKQFEQAVELKKAHDAYLAIIDIMLKGLKTADPTTGLRPQNFSFGPPGTPAILTGAESVAIHEAIMDFAQDRMVKLHAQLLEIGIDLDKQSLPVPDAVK